MMRLVLFGMMRWIMLLVEWLWHSKINHILLNLSNLTQELVNSLRNAFDKHGHIWEHQLQWVNIFVLVVLDCILDFSVESLFLDVLSFDRLVPLVVESLHRGHHLAHVIENSSDLSHDLKIRVASVIHS